MRGSKVRVGILFLVFGVFLLKPLPANLTGDASVIPPAAQILELKQSQVQDGRSQPCVFYSSAGADTADWQAVVAFPGESTGGYMYGSLQSLAEVFARATAGGFAAGVGEADKREPKAAVAATVAEIMVAATAAVADAVGSGTRTAAP